MRQATLRRRKRVNQVALTLSLGGHGLWRVLADLDPVRKPSAWVSAG